MEYVKKSHPNVRLVALFNIDGIEEVKEFCVKIMVKFTKLENNMAASGKMNNISRNGSVMRSYRSIPISIIQDAAHEMDEEIDTDMIFMNSNEDRDIIFEYPRH